MDSIGRSVLTMNRVRSKQEIEERHSVKLASLPTCSHHGSRLPDADR